MKPTVLTTCVALLVFACNTGSRPTSDIAQYTEVQTGGVKMISVAGKYQVWTKKIGSGDIKVLLLHGGPGFPHDYFECFENFLPQAGMEFYYYDQLGVGNSALPTDTTLWTVDRYVEEVEEVRKGLGLENFYILGHSWGSMLTMTYLQKYQEHVKGAVLSNMSAGIQSYVAYSQELKQKFFTPTEIKTYDSLDKLKAFGAAEYQELLMNKLYSKVICQLDPWPEPLARAFKKANTNIYMQMQGVDEFHVTGNFKNWEMWDKLGNIKVPTLVIGGMNDEMKPDDMIREGKLIPNSRTYLCPNGSHLSMYDDQQNYFKNLIGFLKDVQENKFTPDPKE
ncbi:MAG: proline iminopeptidase-family hydrolase [Bacteroidota bacterium]